MADLKQNEITSPAGTADTMETLAPVDLDLKTMRRVVEQELGCIVWGGTVNLSPADDILIRVERVMDLDSEGQLIASVLSKKNSAGSTHIVIDIPVGPTAKVRNFEMAKSLEKLFQVVGKVLGMTLTILRTDGSQPVGRGIGPALEAQDVLAVLQNKPDAPQDLRESRINISRHDFRIFAQSQFRRRQKNRHAIIGRRKSLEKISSHLSCSRRPS